MSDEEKKSLDKVDMQYLIQGLIYFQTEIDDKQERITKAFRTLTIYYNKQDTTKIKDPTPSRPEIDVLYQYSPGGEEEFEKNIMELETECSSMYSLISSLYKSLYPMEPYMQPGQEQMISEKGIQQPSQTITINPQQSGFSKFFSNLFSKKTPQYVIDDLSPYRRSQNLIDEVQNTPNLLQRLVSFHEMAKQDVTLFPSIITQRERLEIEKYFIKSWVRPQILKMVHAAQVALITLEQKDIAKVVTKHYEEIERHRLDQPPAFR